jgi:hypothetical protein
VVTETQNTAKLELFRSTLSRARFNKSIGKLADEAFATKDPAVKVAHDVATMRAANAWKSEFQQAIALAASHLPLSKPRTLVDRSAVKELIKALQKLLRGQRPRPPVKASPRIPAAEFAAVSIARAAKRLWRINNRRQRVPPEVTEKLITDAIKSASLQFSVPENMIRRDAIKRLLNKK